MIILIALNLHMQSLFSATHLTFELCKGWLHSQHESIISESRITSESAATPYI